MIRLSISTFFIVFGSYALCVNLPTKVRTPIVIVYRGFPKIENVFYISPTFKSTTTDKEVVCYDGLNQINCTPAKKNTDTIVVYPRNKNILIRHRLDAINYHEYLVQQGDTVIFTYKANLPTITICNRIVKTFDYTFEKLVSRFYIGVNSPMIKYLSSDLFINYKQPLHLIRKQSQEFRKKAYSETILFLSKQSMTLDSLLKKESISLSNYTFYKQRAVRLIQDFSIRESEVNISEFKNHAPIASDDIHPLYYSELIETASDKFYHSQVVSLDLKDGINKDYRQVYKLLTNSSLFTEQDREWLLTREFRRIANTFGKDDFQKFYTLFKEDVKDSTLQNQIRREFALQLMPTENKQAEITLVKPNQSTTTLTDVLKQHQGKIIYVDFWASWCAPCREGMKFSIPLRQELSNKSIVFLYLSIDKTIIPWQRANEKEGLNTYPETYLITESVGTKKFMTEQNLATIPRYMIFDKAGKLVNANAPRVESKELKPLLLKLAQ